MYKPCRLSVLCMLCMLCTNRSHFLLLDPRGAPKLGQLGTPRVHVRPRLQAGRQGPYQYLRTSAWQYRSNSLCHVPGMAAHAA
jgi:hypothetical protein